MLYYWCTQADGRRNELHCHQRTQNILKHYLTYGCPKNQPHQRSVFKSPTEQWEPYNRSEPMSNERVYKTAKKWKQVGCMRSDIDIPTRSLTACATPVFNAATTPMFATAPKAKSWLRRMLLVLASLLVAGNKHRTTFSRCHVLDRVQANHSKHFWLDEVLLLRCFKAASISNQKDAKVSEDHVAKPHTWFQSTPRHIYCENNCEGEAG